MTRGTWGFVLDGKEFLTYNHSDSYPERLGVHLLEFMRAVDLDSLRHDVRRLRLVEQTARTPKKEVRRLARIVPPCAVEDDAPDWYTVLRNAQGDPALTLIAGVMTDDAEFPLDSLSCEWVYVIDLDAGTFEVHEGHQKEPHEEGRFARRTEGRPDDRGYHPVRLVASFPLADLPDRRGFLAACEGPR